MFECGVDGEKWRGNVAVQQQRQNSTSELCENGGYGVLGRCVGFFSETVSGTHARLLLKKRVKKGKKVLVAPHHGSHPTKHT